jgi:transcriptional regulator with XRE-family HTH domain
VSRNAHFNLEPTSTDEPGELSKIEFGRRLQQLMLRKEWNQSDVARKADLGRDAISMYIRGKSFPEPKNLAKLARAFGMTAAELLPNAEIRAIDADQLPMLEIKQAANHPDKVMLRINRMVNMTQAAAIVAILRDANEDDG